MTSWLFHVGARENHGHSPVDRRRCYPLTFNWLEEDCYFCSVRVERSINLLGKIQKKKGLNLILQNSSVCKLSNQSTIESRCRQLFLHGFKHAPSAIQMSTK